MSRLLLQQLSNVLYIFVADKWFGLWNKNSKIFTIWCLRVVEWCWHWLFYRPGEGATEDLEKTTCINASSGIHNSVDRRDQSKGLSVDPEMLGLESKLWNHSVNWYGNL